MSKRHRLITAGPLIEQTLMETTPESHHNEFSCGNYEMIRTFSDGRYIERVTKTYGVIVKGFYQLYVSVIALRTSRW